MGVVMSFRDGGDVNTSLSTESVFRAAINTTQQAQFHCPLLGTETELGMGSIFKTEAEDVVQAFIMPSHPLYPAKWKG